METMLTANVPAIPGSTGVARQTAGIQAFIRTNTDFGATGGDPTLSGGTSGYPLAGAISGTARAFTEVTFNDILQECWVQGADPSMSLVNANNKRIISETFVGNATRYKDTVDQKVINAIDFYESDFGTVTIVPTRFLLPSDGVGGTNYSVLVLDPSFISIDYLQAVQQKPLAETGHNQKRLLWAEYGLRVDNEASCGIIRDLDGVLT
jgi:hypothetical protein